MILDSDVAREWSRSTGRFKIAGLWGHEITLSVIGDLLSVEHDDGPGSVQSDLEFVPFPGLALRMCQRFGQGIEHTRTVIFATHVAFAVVDLHLITRVQRRPLIRGLFRDANKDAGIAISD